MNGMQRLAELPSLKEISEIILAEGRAGQLILFSIPDWDIWNKWREYLLQALKNRLLERGEETFWQTLQVDTIQDNPHELICDYLALPQPAGQDELLTAPANEQPLIIELDCDGKSLGNGWRDFIVRTARYFRVSDSVHSCRCICIFVLSPAELPPVPTDAGLRCFAFWNPLRWEEARLIAADAVQEHDNVLARTWQISSYSGAANADPDILARLTRNVPQSLREIREQLNSCRKQKSSSPNVPTAAKRFYTELRWNVPTGLVDIWLGGCLLGNTLDRGAIIPWNRVSEKEFDKILNRSVWREQVAGLFPLLMEITYYVAEEVTRRKGDSWKRYLGDNNEYKAISEPGDILTVFHRHRYQLGRLPDKLYNLLQQLRKVRNKLAHLEPVDLHEVNQIWRLFQQIQK